jgi:hypothetical protein
MAEEIKVYDWDDMITDDGQETYESVVLPEGKYPFEVIKMEKGFYEGSAKMPACNMAKMFLRIDGGELGTSLCVETLFLVEKSQWKAANFLRSIGLKKHGEPVQWRTLEHCDGESGRCEVYVDSYEKNGKQYTNNKIRRFFDKEEQQPKKAFTKGAF